MDKYLILKIICGLISCLIFFLLISYFISKPKPAQPPRLSDDKKYELFDGMCLDKNNKTPNNYTKFNETFDDCNKTCEDNDNCQGFSYLPANSIDNNSSLCTIYSSNLIAMNLQDYKYNFWNNTQEPITQGDDTIYYTCYNKI